MLGLEANQECSPVNNIILTDEAHFWGDGYVNNQNYRFWGTTNPNQTAERSLHLFRVVVWAAVSIKRVFIQFLEDNVTSASYYELLNTKWFPFAEHNGAIAEYWFQQDGASSHCTEQVTKLLADKYENRVISRKFVERHNGGMEWPPYSPDLTVCDFFLWGYIKEKVYSLQVKDTPTLKAAVYSAVGAITTEMLERVYLSLYRRLECCHLSEGAHFEHILH